MSDFLQSFFDFSVSAWNVFDFWKTLEYIFPWDQNFCRFFGLFRNFGPQYFLELGCSHKSLFFDILIHPDTKASQIGCVFFVFIWLFVCFLCRVFFEIPCSILHFSRIHVISLPPDRRVHFWSCLNNFYKSSHLILSLPWVEDDRKGHGTVAQFKQSTQMWRSVSCSLFALLAEILPIFSPVPLPQHCMHSLRSC